MSPLLSRIGTVLAVAVLTAGTVAPAASATPVKRVTPVPQAPAWQRPGLLQPDPLVALLPDPSKVDLGQIARQRVAKAQARARLARPSVAAPARYAEREPAGVIGVNDTQAKAERITAFGTGTGKKPRIALHGTLAPSPGAPTLPQAPEDNGSIPLAASLGVPGQHPMIRTGGVIGDGPHGTAGDGTGDFDFYKLTGGPTATRATIKVSTTGSPLLPVILVYTAAGDLSVFNAGPYLDLPLPAGEDLYVVISGFGPLPADPHDSGSGNGAGSEGPYGLTVFTTDVSDRDFYALDLKAGDVVGASVTGAAHRLSLVGPDGTEAESSSQDASGLYPAASPLPGGGNAVLDFVAPRSGRYALAVNDGDGAYDVTLEGYRPGTETEKKNAIQTIFLDFDGARINTRIFGGGGGVRQLSPLKSFLAGWGLAPSDEGKLADTFVATVRENVQRDLAAKGPNPNFGVRILDSRHDPDPFGQPNVTRLVVGGTIEESGIGTIGIAESVDPGNFGHEETAIILLDLLSSPAGPDYSINTYLTPASDRIAFIGRALGNVTSHELGHLSGNWHVDQFDDVPSLMDQGGNASAMFGVGPDGVGGTRDDADVDFNSDTLNPREGFTGTEDTLARTAWAYSKGTG
ncbi:MAG: hypothetical protein JWO79_4263 [Actinomycetia bacterium]|nr:hypothetical protein [Actinomycetes bacterium]